MYFDLDSALQGCLQVVKIYDIRWARTMACSLFIPDRMLTRFSGFAHLHPQPYEFYSCGLSKAIDLPAALFCRAAITNLILSIVDRCSISLRRFKTFLTNKLALMSYSYERVDRRRTSYGASSRRTAFGYWIPLAVTVTAATIGLAAWIWSERKDDDDEYYDGKPPYNGPAPSQGPPPPGWQGPPVGPDYQGPPPGPGPTYQGPPGGPGLAQPLYAQQEARGEGAPPPAQEGYGMMTQISSVIRRTPSPQQIFDAASRKAVAGVAAAGAAVGGALTSIREEDKDFEDHSRWSEEAETRTGTSATRGAGSSKSRGKRKIVAIVLSADTGGNSGHQEDAYHHEHAVSPEDVSGSEVIC